MFHLSSICFSIRKKIQVQQSFRYKLSMVWTNQGACSVDLDKLSGKTRI